MRCRVTRLPHKLEQLLRHGAKPHFLIEDKLEDRSWLTELITLTANELPEPRAKKIR
jgi:hypothetical protein